MASAAVRGDATLAAYSFAFSAYTYISLQGSHMAASTKTQNPADFILTLGGICGIFQLRFLNAISF